jgi:hypothetical protein
MRALLVIAALALLGACNMVTTKAPLFAKADGVHGPKLRPGVWSQNPTGDCTLDESKPLTDWPSCADGFVVVDDGTIGGYEQKDGKQIWSTTQAIVAAGDPLIFQIHLTADAGAGAMSPDGYLYAGMEPTKLDGEGRAVATRSWPVLCGPPPAADAKGPDGAQKLGTAAPFPGLVMDAQGNDCTTDSREVLRAAAKASRKLTPDAQLAIMHWVRDGKM